MDSRYAHSRLAHELAGRHRRRTLRNLILCCALGIPLFMGTRCPGQQISANALDELSRRTGLSKEELLRRIGEMTPPTPAESTEVGAPGRTELPSEQPQAPQQVPATPEQIPVTPKQIPPPLPGPGALPPPKAPPVMFGSSFFKLEPGIFTQSAFGPVPEDYVINAGDEIVVDVWGDVEFRIERVVDRDGTIIIPKGGKVLCSGRTLAEVKHAVRDLLSRSYSGISLDPDVGTTYLDVSLGKLRSIRVFVVGDAVQPGAYELGSVATIFTALYAAGGPSPTGSMRDIRVVRGDQTVARFDVYDYLTEGNRKNDVTLHEYDTVFIPPRGKTVSLKGEVRRPMSFELKDGETAHDLLRFGGGFTAEAATEVLHVKRILPSAERRPGQPDRVQIDIPSDLAAGGPADSLQVVLLDGDSVTVGLVSIELENWVEILGPVKRPGRYEYTEGLDVAALVEQAGRAWPKMLEQRALVDRIDPDGTFKSFTFPLGDVLAGRASKVLLHPMDTVRIYSRWDLQDRSDVAISGEVREPGRVTYREGMTLRDLILKAGGLKESADLLEAEVSRLHLEGLESQDLRNPPAKTVDLLTVPLGADFLTQEDSFFLAPHDEVTIRRLPWWRSPQVVTLSGEVFFPGRYTLVRDGETLSEVIARAKGLKPTAFPAGATLIRTQNSQGNIAIDLDCAVNDPHSPCDLILFNGDQIQVPSEPQTVQVLGAVGYPTNILFNRGKPLGYYVNRAGGYAEGANRWKTRIVYPNGLSRPIRRLWRDPAVLPGSAIVIPYQPQQQKGDKLATLEKIAAIFASLATAYLVIDRTTQ